MFIVPVLTPCKAGDLITTELHKGVAAFLTSKYWSLSICINLFVNEQRRKAKESTPTKSAGYDRISSVKMPLDFLTLQISLIGIFLKGKTGSR